LFNFLGRFEHPKFARALMKAPTKKPLRLLLVEDEALIALDVEGRVLEQRHEVVGVAADAAEALALAQSQEIDLALSTSICAMV
jgi:ActR/RegA family two-component response regulator